MLATFWRVVTALLLLLALAWAAWWRDAPAVALAGALFIGLLHVPVMAIEFFVLLPLLNRGDPSPRASFGQRARAWWHECTTAVAVFGWRLPWRTHAEPDHLEPHTAGRRAVVLVHGYLCNRALWNPWMRKLRAAGIPFVAVDLEPVFRTSITAYAAIVDRAVQRATRATGVAPLIVAHSMGGLAARAWLHAFADGDTRVAGVITIGTPHHGTSLARLAYSPNARDMRRAGAWLTELGAHEPATRWTRFTCFWSHCDNIVLPASTATLPGARNVHLEGAAHVALIDRPEVWAEVLRQQQLSSPPPSAQ
jgi:triacylglycerol lipase